MDLRALIVEDEPALQHFYEKVLQRAGYAVDSARDGRMALDYLQSQPVPQLIILDIRLPDIDGTEVLRFISQYPELQTAHVVIATAGKEYEQYLGAVPSSEFLLKPILPSQVTAIAAWVRDRVEA